MTTGFEKRDEGGFEPAQRDVGAERAAQLRRAPHRRVARDARLDVPRRRPVANPRLMAGAGELGGLQTRREVEQHPRHDRDRDGVERAEVADLQGAHAVDDDVRALAVRRRRRRDLRRRRCAAEQPEHAIRAAVAK